ncbi:MAG: site-2 protease family protein [Gemmatimonadetes bacterium]|nr:site-2 protease family protein [Gemmatimonadota bacterium]MBT8404148.1 site-2 protease family protein [Gemmatimonadota bacterium]NNF37919.1 site-2 protease family protein [Gemmatimonadota bacterium]NNK63554.1 site-2 protease family protein [Gemmatimonadota bacterium]
MILALFIPILLASIVLHELAHAWQARREGDPTAERLGRITLNPFAHLDWVGSFFVPALLYSMGGLIFGWAKPVPIDPNNFRSHPWSDIRVSLAGIVSNLGLALVLTLAAGPLVGWIGGGSPVAQTVGTALAYGIFLNLILAFFNLLPIPPLDGSHVVAHLLPREWAGRYRRFGRYGILALMAIVFFLPDVLGVLLTPVDVVMGWVDSWVRLWR